MASDNNPWVSWTYIQTHTAELMAAGREHILLTVFSMVLAIVVAFPLALIVRRYPGLRSAVLNTSAVLYTIPSLALISALWPVFGLTPTTVILALALYALLVVLRNIIVGFEQVPADVLDAARGMGLSDSQMLRKVELPMAMPTILAGIRVATVSTVGMVTIGALVGYGGYGGMILSGFVQNFWHAQILTATVACVLLAVAFELILLGIQKATVRWR